MPPVITASITPLPVMLVCSLPIWSFYAGLLGVAMNTRIGAFALDVTHSQADIENLGSLSGQSYRLTYSKMIEATDTSFNIAAYRFSTENYLSLSDAAQLNDDIKHGRDDRSIYDSSEALYSNYQRTKNPVSGKH